MKFEDFTTVRAVSDGDVVFVGEEHGNSRCKELCERVIEEVNPNVVAVEKGEQVITKPRTGGGAMTACKDYAKMSDAPLITIDENRSTWRERFPDDVNTTGLISVGNEFSHAIERDGDMEHYSIIDAREEVKNQFGKEVYDAFYTFRERGMIARLNRALSLYEVPIVAAVGTFHIIALQDMWHLVEEEKELGSNRKFYQSSAKIEEGPTARA